MVFVDEAFEKWLDADEIRSWLWSGEMEEGEGRRNAEMPPFAMKP